MQKHVPELVRYCETKPALMRSDAWVDDYSFFFDVCCSEHALAKVAEVLDTELESERVFDPFLYGNRQRDLSEVKLIDTTVERSERRSLSSCS